MKCLVLCLIIYGTSRIKESEHFIINLHKPLYGITLLLSERSQISSDKKSLADDHYTAADHRYKSADAVLLIGELLEKTVVIERFTITSFKSIKHKYFLKLSRLASTRWKIVVDVDLLRTGKYSTIIDGCVIRNSENICCNYGNLRPSCNFLEFSWLLSLVSCWVFFSSFDRVYNWRSKD